MAHPGPAQGNGPARPSKRATLVVIAASVVVAGLLAMANWSGAHRRANLDPALTMTGPQAGATNAPLQVEVFEDYQCPYCGQAAREIFPSFMKNWVATGKAHVVVHDIAFLGPESTVAARAAVCATQQGKYWPFREQLYQQQHGENTGFLTEARMTAFAADQGLKVSEFQACMADPATLTLIKQELDKAKQQGVRSTPTFVINGQNLEGVASYAQFDLVLKNVLAMKK